MNESFILSPIQLTELETILRNCVKSELEKISLAPPQPEEELTTTEEATKILRVSKVTLSKWRKEGRIKFYRIGTRIRFKKSDLLAALQTVRKFGKEKS
jgi:excisionase family DNA binding protein